MCDKILLTLEFQRIISPKCGMINVSAGTTGGERHEVYMMLREVSIFFFSLSAEAGTVNASRFPLRRSLFEKVPRVKSCEACIITQSLKAR